MNERFMELVMRARNESAANCDDRLEKFAELIVRECVMFVPSATQSNAILKHFGVEE